LFKNIHPSFKIVTHVTYTSGNVHDSKEFDKLLGINKHKNKNKIKTCGEVYADSAYANKKNDEKLGQQNNKVLHRAYRNTPICIFFIKSKKTLFSPLFIALFPYF
jgi:hypothetical protein